MNNKLEISKELADKIGIAINLIFNNAIFFGPKHPSTKSATNKLSEHLNSLEEDSFISLIKNGELPINLTIIEFKIIKKWILYPGMILKK